MWEVASSRVKESLYDEAQPARKTENISGSVAGKKETIAEVQSTKNIEDNKRSASEQIEKNINWNERVTRRAGVSSANSAERQTLERDLAVVIGSNASTVRPNTAFDKFKTRSDARIFLKQSRYQIQQALRRKLNQEKLKGYKSSTSIPKGGTIFVGTNHRRNDDFLTVTSLQSSSTSSIHGVRKLLSDYNINDHIVTNENAITDVKSKDKGDKYDARKVREWMQMRIERFSGEDVSRDSELKSDNLADSEISTIPLDGESVCSGPVANYGVNDGNDSSTSEEHLAGSKDDFVKEVENNEVERSVSIEELNETQNKPTETKGQENDCSHCIACKIERIVESLSVVLANQLSTPESDNQVSLAEQVRRKIREDMSVPEESINSLEIHIRRLLAARNLDKNSSREVNLKGTKSGKSRDDEQNEEKCRGDKKEEPIGVLYAENVFQGARKQSLSTSPLNISPNETQKTARTPSPSLKFDGKASKDKIPYRFSYTHFNPSSSSRRVENREQITITGSSHLQTKPAKTKPSDYGISLSIYRNRQKLEKRNKLEEANTKKFILYPKTFRSGSPTVRQYRQDDTPNRLGAWYWDRLEEIEQHRCPPPPNSPVPEEWTDM